MPGGIPAHLRVAKVYYSKDVDAIMDEYNDANSFGNGAAEEWTKGLHTKGKEAMADAARWEKWEGQMRLGSDLTQVLREYDLSSFPRYLQEAQSKSAGVNGAQPVVAANGKPIFQSSATSNLSASAELMCSFLRTLISAQRSCSQANRTIDYRSVA